MHVMYYIQFHSNIQDFVSIKQTKKVIKESLLFFVSIPSVYQSRYLCLAMATITNIVRYMKENPYDVGPVRDF